jgi:hypothetical protein
MHLYAHRPSRYRCTMLSVRFAAACLLLMAAAYACEGAETKSDPGGGTPSASTEQDHAAAVAEANSRFDAAALGASCGDASGCLAEDHCAVFPGQKEPRCAPLEACAFLNCPDGSECLVAASFPPLVGCNVP